MLRINRQDRERLGLSQTLEDCHCVTPQGRRLKSGHRYYGPGDRSLLEAELAAVERLTDYLKHHPREAKIALGHLSQLPELRGTLTRLSSKRTLDLSEFFEIKQAVRLVHKLLTLPLLLEKAGLSLTALPELESLLDPQGLGSSGFYLYDDYSPHLAELRQARARLEEQLEASPEKDRSILMDQRSQLVLEEDKEEARIRKTLSLKIAPFSDRLAGNLESAGQLDFRLAKAELAHKWGAARPDLLEEGATLILEQFYHPVIEAHLQARGAAYQRQTVTIPQGTTVLTGANMGGKSVTLKAMALSVTLIHLGYFPPAAYSACPLFTFVSYSSDYFDTTRRGLSTFASELVKIRDDLKQAGQGPGFIVLDEPFRGTSPGEATALVKALVLIYAGLPGALVMATHYEAPSGDGIRHLRLKGFLTEDLDEIMAGFKGESADEELIRRIESLTDFSIEAVELPTQAWSGAFRLAAWLGLDQNFLDMLEDEEEGSSWRS